MFDGFLESAVWQHDLPTRVVWITLHAMADGDGHVESSIGGLARRAGVTIEECARALKTLMAPNPHENRAVSPDGHLVDAHERGWLVLDHKWSRPEPVRIEPKVETYFIQSGGEDGPVKIGRTTDLAKRIASLSTGSPKTLRVLRVMDGDHESAMHWQFKHLRVRGEWFAYDGMLKDFLESDLAEAYA